MMDAKFLALDCETGGMSVKESLFTAYFAVMTEDKKIISELSFKLKPRGTGYVYTKQALQANRIDPSELIKTAISLEEGTEKLKQLLSPYMGSNRLIPLGQNISFDFKFIWHYLLNQKEWYQFCTEEIEDTLVIAKKLKKDGKLHVNSMKLGVLCAHLGIPLMNAHSEKDDTIAAAYLHTRLKQLESQVKSKVKASKSHPLEIPKCTTPSPLDGPIPIVKVISGYSILRSPSSVDDYIEKAIKTGSPCVAIADLGYATSALEVWKKCKSKNIVGIPATTIYVADGPSSYELTLWAVTEEGYKNLLKISSLSWSKERMEGRQRHQDTGLGALPRVSLKELTGLLGGIAVGTGGVDGLLARKGGEEVDGVLAVLKSNAHAVFLEVTPRPLTHKFDPSAGGFVEISDENGESIDLQLKVNNHAFSFYGIAGIPLILSVDAHYTDPDERDVREMIVSSLDQTGSLASHRSLHIPTMEEAWAYFEQMHGPEVDYFTEAVLGAYQLSDMASTLEIKSVYRLPETQLPEDIKEQAADHREGLKMLIMRKIEEHGRMKWDDEVWTKRLSWEMEVICDNVVQDFAEYFTFLEKWMAWCRAHSILTAPGRGSGAGSLLCYLLKITHLDPVQYKLPFSRFLSPSRVKRQKWPDIDSDFGDRGPLLAKLAEVYGDKFAQVSTHGTLRIKSGIKEAFKILQVAPLEDRIDSMEKGSIRDLAIENLEKMKAQVEDITKPIPPTPTGQSDINFLIGYEDKEGNEHEGYLWQDEHLQNFFKEYSSEDLAKDLKNMVERMLGIPRSIGRHASAYLISNVPINESAPICNIGGHVCTQYTAPPIGFNSAESAGLIKFDFLGVGTLLDVSNAVRLIQRDKGYNVWLQEFEINGEKFKLWQGELPVEQIPGPTGGILDIYDLPEDADVLKDVSDGKTEACFQIKSALMTGYCKRIKPDVKDDLSIIVAIIRSGPLEAETEQDDPDKYLKDEDGNPVIDLETGQKRHAKLTMTEAYVKRKHGKVPVTYAHPDMEPILKDTFGVACLPAGSILNSAFGNINIEHVKCGDKLLTSNGSRVWEGEVEKIWSTGSKKLLKIITSSGKCIKSSEDHRFMTVDGDVTASQLKGGTGKSWQDSSIIFEKWPQASNEISLNKNEAYLIGLLNADGCMANSTVYITCGSELAAQWASNLMSETFGGKPTYHFNTRAWYAASVQTSGVRNKSFVPQALDRIYGSREWKTTGTRKHLPGNVLRYCEKDRIDFVRGLWDGDGTYCGPYFFRNNSIILLDQMCDLLGSLKISFLRRSNSVQAIDTKRFLDIIGGPLIPNKIFNDLSSRELPLPAKMVYEWSINLNNEISKEIKSYKTNVMKAARLGGMTQLTLQSHPDWSMVYTDMYERTYMQDVRPVMVDSVSTDGCSDCYDIQMKDQNNPYFMCNGIVVHNCYQEQLQEMFSSLAGYSEEEADYIRELFSKKKMQDVDKIIPELRKRLIARGWTDDQVKVFVSLCISSAKYSFNRAHSASYGTVAYMCAYLKHHYPKEWWTAVLQNCKIEEIRENGYDRALRDILVLPHVNGPTETFEPRDDGKVHAPLWLIDGVGDVACGVIKKAIDERANELATSGNCPIEDVPYESAFYSLQEFFERCAMGGPVNEGTLKRLIIAGAFDHIEPNRGPKDLMREYLTLKKVSKLKVGEGKMGFELKAACTEWYEKNKDELPKDFEESLAEMDMDGVELQIKRMELLPIYRNDVHDNFRELLAKYIVHHDGGTDTYRTKDKFDRTQLLPVLRQGKDILSFYEKNKHDRYKEAVWVGLLESKENLDFNDKKQDGSPKVRALKMKVVNQGDAVECILWPNALEIMQKMGRPTPDGKKILLCAGPIKPSRQPGMWSMSVNKLVEI
jgi:DNA polymerase III subunit alpha